ncbi:MAG: hypothetical protein M3460_16495 [Actinomycetota bacterium]|nr:hypothetical protein [Actinomycetota bacterium]
MLQKVVGLSESTGEHLEPELVLGAFAAEQHDAVRHSLRRLNTHGYIEAVTSGPTMGDSRVHILRIKGVTERALRAVGAWPDNAELLADRILAVLAEGAEHEPEPEKRSKLQAGLKGVGGMTRDVLVDVLGAALAKSTGLG